MISGWRIEGHAIVSSDDRIAGPDGRTPDALRNPADWARFQAALDAAAVVVLGRIGHEHNPNLRRRNRLVLSRSVAGLEHRPDAWWWNPAAASADEALAAAAPAGGTAAVTGGREVFDLFLGLGYDAFHLSRATRAALPKGVPLFSAVAEGRTAEAIFRGVKMEPGRLEWLDPREGVSLTVWRARSTASAGSPLGPVV